MLLWTWKMHFSTVAYATEANEDRVKKIGEHRHLIEDGKNKHSVPCNFSGFHKKSTQGLNCLSCGSYALETPIGFHRLCQRETFWIYNINTLSPCGLSEELEVNSIL